MGWLGDALGTWATVGLNKTVLPALGGGNKPPGADYSGSDLSDLSNYGQNPNSSSLAGMLSSMPKFSAISDSDISKQYDPIRARINSQYSEVQSQGQDAIDRQFAAMGGGPGNGAQLKQSENLATSVAKQKGQDLQSLEAEQAQAGLSAKQYNNQGQMQQNQFDFGAKSQIAGLDLSWQQAQAEAKNNAFNKELSQYQATHSGGLLGGGGFLGIGIGA